MVRLPAIQEISSYEALCAIEPEWSALLARVPSASPFQSPEWLLPWYKHLFRGGQMWTLAVRSGERLTGLAPMFIHGLPGEPRQVSFIGSGVTDYLGFLDEDDSAASQLWSAIAAGADRWDVCDFQEIAERSAMLDVPAVGVAIERCISTACPVVRLPPAMDQLEAGLSPKFRHNLRNARNRLASAGAVFESARADQDGEYIEALFRLHTQRWRSKGEPGVLASVAMQSFLREVAARFRERGWLRFYGLRLDGELMAAVCIFCTNSRCAYYAGGFSGDLSRYSPGSVLVAFAIEQAIAERCTEFDFLRHPDRYKYTWGAADRMNYRLMVRRSESSATIR